MSASQIQEQLMSGRRAAFAPGAQQTRSFLLCMDTAVPCTLIFKPASHDGMLEVRVELQSTGKSSPPNTLSWQQTHCPKPCGGQQHSNHLSLRKGSIAASMRP